MNKLRCSIAKRRRLNNVAYHASRDVLTHEFKQAAKALSMLEIKPNKRVRRICN